MKLTIEGSDRVALPPDEVAAALRDPAVLTRAVPGDGGVERTGPRVATVMATAGIAGTRGTYRARVHVVDATQDRFVLRIAAAGEPGTIEAELTVELHADAAGTRIHHQLEATLDGRLAGLGRHVLAGAVASGVSRFVADLETAVGTPVPVATTAASPPSPTVPSSDRAVVAVAEESPGGAVSTVRTALVAAVTGAIATAGALRWWHARQDD